jgi:16S rRNA (guanine527-N7)-methyltransferase
VIAARALLASGAQAILGRPLERREGESFDRYLVLLQRWQRVQRLVGSTDPSWVVRNLFLDSLLFLSVLPAGIGAIADLGSGAGLPGIPIKIVSPRLRLTLIESRQRRASFLSAVVRDLQLDRVLVSPGRAEEAPAALLGSHDAVLMRCAGDPRSVLPAARKLAAAGGVVVCAGPPHARPTPWGEWVEVPGLEPGSTRRFLVVRV